MSERTGRRLRHALTFGVGVGMFLVLAAPLPGEQHGCGGDTSGAVDVREYCRDKCDVEAQKLRLCNEIEATDAAEQANYLLCLTTRQCDGPMYCVDMPNPFISNGEADQCFRAIENLPCHEIDLDEVDGLIEYVSGTPGPCTQEELCDPL